MNLAPDSLHPADIAQIPELNEFELSMMVVRAIADHADRIASSPKLAPAGPQSIEAAKGAVFDYFQGGIDSEKPAGAASGAKLDPTSKAISRAALRLSLKGYDEGKGGQSPSADARVAALALAQFERATKKPSMVGTWLGGRSKSIPQPRTAESHKAEQQPSGPSALDVVAQSRQAVGIYEKRLAIMQLAAGREPEVVSRTGAKLDALIGASRQNGLFKRSFREADAKLGLSGAEKRVMLDALSQMAQYGTHELEGISELDAGFARGSISEDAYKASRAQLLAEFAGTKRAARAAVAAIMEGRQVVQTAFERRAPGPGPVPQPLRQAAAATPNRTGARHRKPARPAVRVRLSRPAPRHAAA